MQKEWFLTRCCQTWSPCFPLPITGHLFCISSTTHLLLLSVDPFIVVVQGHWSSNAFLAYWWNCQEIIPLFIGFSLDSQSSILMTMSHFKDHLTNKFCFWGSWSPSACQLVTSHSLVLVEPSCQTSCASSLSHLPQLIPGYSIPRKLLQTLGSYRVLC